MTREEWSVDGKLNERWPAQALSTTSSTSGTVQATQVSEPLDDEDADWLDADLSRLAEEEPYDWGGHDPLTLGEPVTLGDDGTIQVAKP